MATLFSLLSTTIYADKIDIDALSGSWHLRILDGGEVRKARAILDFKSRQMKLDGFDGCNRISGNLVKDTKTQHYSAHLLSTRMECREPIHAIVRKKLHETIAEGFSIKEDEKHGVEGITIKSSKHELFFKRMEGNNDWF